MTKKKEEKKLEKRSLSTAEVRAEKADDGKMSVRGYAIVYNQWADDGYGGRERVAPGAAKKTLKESPDIRALWNYNSDLVIGRTSNNTLRLKEDDHGLAIELDLPDSPLGHNAFASIDRGDVDQMSFGFNLMAMEDKENPDDKNARDITIKEIRLHEVSPVTFPFYPTTKVGVREAMEKAGADDPMILRTLENLHVGQVDNPAGPVTEDHSQDQIKEPSVEGHSDENEGEKKRCNKRVSCTECDWVGVWGDLKKTHWDDGFSYGVTFSCPDGDCIVGNGLVSLERNADEPVSADHSKATELEVEDNQTVEPQVDAETSTGELSPVSKTLIKMQKMNEEQLRQQLDARFKSI